ncbi:MAG: tRNA lysidine(34) synthetase TilS [bacterium]|nr:tRNA lysidine(34) synthetase TilS [bacterium]
MLVAFSGGPDSTALLAGLVRVAPALSLNLHAAHLDHALDPDSERRAARACRLAAAIGAPLTLERLSPGRAGRTERSAGERSGRDGLEAWARRRRYAFLDRLADELGARFIVTAHHADDQAETVLLRLLFGSGLEGLAAIRPRRGRLVRPLLGLRRSQLLCSLAGSHLEPVTDPTNAGLATPRNRIRHQLLPSLASADPRIVERLCRLAAAARLAGERIDRLLGSHLSPRGDPSGIAVDRTALDALPAALFPHALALLHRRAGAPYPAGASARGELERQLGEQKRRGGGRIGCDCGDGWRWESDSDVLRLVRRKSPGADFTYTLAGRGTGRGG